MTTISPTALETSAELRRYYDIRCLCKWTKDAATPPVPEFLDMVRFLGVRIFACSTTMGVMGSKGPIWSRVARSPGPPPWTSPPTPTSSSTCDGQGVCARLPGHGRNRQESPNSCHR